MYDNLTRTNLEFAYRKAEKQIAELEKENERLKGDLELWESGGCRTTNLFECGVVKELKSELTKKADTNHSLVEQMADLESENAELKQRIEKMKCCGNCNKISLSGYCSVKQKSIYRIDFKCDKWEIKE